MIPDAIGVGCRRCASSWLHRVLNQHPAIGKPERGLHFFSENLDKGCDWYQATLDQYSDRELVLEYSITYAYPEFAKDAARAIHVLSPEIKIFATIRNPVDRAFSDYLRSVRHLEIPADVSFEDAIKRMPELIERGKYGKIFQHYFDLFPRENIHFCLFDDLASNASKFVREILSFLDVDQTSEEQLYERSSGASGSIANPAIASMIQSVKSGADSLALKINPELWKSVKRKFKKQYIALLSANTKPVELSDATRIRLVDEYRPDLERFQELSGVDVSHWRVP